MSGVPVVEQFLAAFNAGDIDAMGAVFADDAVCFVTDASGAERQIDRAAYLAALEAMDLPSAEYRVTLTQAPVIVGDQVLIMVEVHASRGDRTLHNYAAHLVRVRGGRIAELRMADAKPAESDAFWSAAPPPG
jgi:ketosteroid isomerase-like protein